jgi:hypothetical protein
MTGQANVACPSVFFFWPLCCLSFCPFVLAIVLLVLLSFSFCHCVACPSVVVFGHCVAFPRRTSNKMAKEKGQKDKQHNGQKKRDRRTSNTMTKEKEQKDKQHNGQKKLTEGQATQ